MLLEDRIYFIEARDRRINAKFISMCSFFEAVILTPWEFPLSETKHLDNFTVQAYNENNSK